MSYRAMNTVRQLLASIPASHITNAATQQVIVTGIAELDAAIEELDNPAPVENTPTIPTVLVWGVPFSVARFDPPMSDAGCLRLLRDLREMDNTMDTTPEVSGILS